MDWRRAGAVGVAAVLLAVVPTSAPGAATVAGNSGDLAAITAASVTPTGPDSWGPHRLAAQLVLAGVDMGHLSDAVGWAQDGIGGIVLFGTPPSDIGHRLSAVRDAEQVPPIVASDEEGGLVQRLTSVIYALPSAEWMGAHRTPARVHDMARAYARHMWRLGVDMDLAPVADLLVPGHYISDTHRAFASDPDRVARYVNAWQHGMRASHVVTIAKHWPGHGHADDTHSALAVTPRLSYLKAHDLIPFASALAHGIPAVMVGHLVVPGLTETSHTPASLSWHALHYLRDRAGDRTLLVTDSLSMGAIRDSLGLTQSQAAVRALRDGADMALVQVSNPRGVVHAVADAIRSGSYPRARAVASVERILAAKRISTAPYRPSSLQPARDATGVALTAQLSAVVDDRLGGWDHAFFSVRRAGATSWNVVSRGRAGGRAGGRITYDVPVGALRPAHTYEWRVRACNAAARCSAWSAIRAFTTA